MAEEMQRKARESFSNYTFVGRVIRTWFSQQNGGVAVLRFEVILSNVTGKGDERKEVPYVPRCVTFGASAEMLNRAWGSISRETPNKPRVLVAGARPQDGLPVKVKNLETGREYNSRETEYVVPPYGVTFLDAAPQSGSQASQETPAQAEVPAGNDPPF